MNKKTNAACVIGNHEKCPREADGLVCICPCHTPQQEKDEAIIQEGLNKLYVKPTAASWEEPVSERQKRYASLLLEVVEEGGFTEQQAKYLIDLLDRFIPVI